MSDIFTKYLERTQTRDLIHKQAKQNLGFVIVIPCCDEPDFHRTLESLLEATPPAQVWEIIVVINHEATASLQVKQQNNRTNEQIRLHFASRFSNRKIPIHTLFLKEVPHRYAGVGFARKTGMDQAILRLHQAGNTEGVLVSLDADTTVAGTYYQSIEDAFSKKRLDGAHIAFAHQRTSDPSVNLAITLYELHLRYVVACIQSIPHPSGIHTLGSAFCVTATAYCRQGGMNRKQGGEDYYFIQKIAAQGHYGEILHTKVFPASRTSSRIPFGTGPAIQEILNNDMKLSSYPAEAFTPLSHFFQCLRDNQTTDITSLYHKLHPPIQHFLPYSTYIQYLEEIRKNTQTEAAYYKRLYHKFNGLFVIRFLNHFNRQYKGERDITALCYNWLKKKESGSFSTLKKDPFQLLDAMRKQQEER